MAESRTPAEIEEAIVRKRQELAATLDEIAVRVHPQTIIGDAKARAVSAVDQTTGRAHDAVDRALSAARGQLVAQDGTLRLERVVPLALVAAAVVGVWAYSSARSASRSSGRRRRG